MNATVDFCPRCGTRRTPGYVHCTHCGLDLESISLGSSPTAPGWNSAARDVRLVSDRQTMARVSRAALDVRCLGTLGGLVGLFIGFFVGGYVGLVLGGPALIITLPVGLILGMYLGMRVALGWAARE